MTRSAWCRFGALGQSMRREREYDLFERFPDGSPIWRGRASGLNDAEAKLRNLASTTTNECFALYLPTKEIVLRVNAAASADPEADLARC
jgi:hypothetical protein